MQAVRERAAPLVFEADRATAWLGGLFMFSFVTAVTILKSGSNSLLLGVFEASILPWLYVATPAAVGLALLLLVTPQGRSRLAAGSFAAAGLTMALFFLLPRQPEWTVLVLYLFGEASATALSVGFWEQIGTLFDARTAKRVYGLLGAAGMAGAIAGGLFVQRCSVSLGTRLLLPFAAAALLLAGAASVLLSQRLPGGPSPEAGVPPAGNGPLSTFGTWAMGMKLLARDRYPTLIALLTVMLSILTVAVDFLFRSRARALLHDNLDGLTSVFGSVNLVVGVVSIIFQVFFTGWLLARLDVRGYLLAILASIGAAAGFGMVGLGFVPVYMLKVAESSASLSLTQPAVQLLYHPIRPGQRVVVRGLIDGLLKKLGIALGGVMLIVSLPLAQQLVSEVGVLLLLLPAAALVLLLHREHRRMLERRVSLSFAAGAQPALLEDEGARDSLVRALQDSEPSTVLTALALARRDPAFDLTPHLPRLVAHPSPEVRREAVRLAGPGRDRPFLHLMSLLAVERSGLQAEEVGPLARLLPEKAPFLLLRLLHSPDTRVRCGAIEALYPLEANTQGPAHAQLQRLALWSRTAPTAERQALAELYGRLGDRNLARLLVPLLKDQDLGVRRAAIESAGRLRDPALLHELLEGLADRTIRQTVVRALARYGDTAADFCEQWLNDRNRSLEVRLRIPAVLRRIGSEAAGRALLFSNIEDDPFLRDRIAEALGRIRREHPTVAFDPRWSAQALERRVNSFAYYAPVYDDLLAMFRPNHLLLRLLNDRLLQNVCVSFRVLSLQHPVETLNAIRLRWLFGNRHQRADALTLLESLLPPETRPRVVGMLEHYDRLRDGGLVYRTALAAVTGGEGVVSAGAVQAWYAASRRPSEAAAASAPDGTVAAGSGGRASPGPDDEEHAPATSRGEAHSGLLPLVLAEGVIGPGQRTGSGVHRTLEPQREQAALQRLRDLARSRDLLLRAVASRTAQRLDENLRQQLGPLPSYPESEMPETLMDRLLFLQSVDLFEHQRVDDLVAIASIVEERSFAAGEVIYRAGDPSDALYIIMEGEVELTLDGKHVMTNTPGESFGQLSMLDRKPRPTTATAVGPVRTLALGRLEFFDLISDRSELMQGVLEVLVKRIRSLLEEVVRVRGES